MDSAASERESVEALRQAGAFDAYPLATAVVDLDCRIIGWNLRAQALLGWSAEEVLGRPMTIVVPADRRTEIETAVAWGRREGLSSYQTVRRRRDGTDVVVAVDLAPLADDDGVIVGFIGCLREIPAGRPDADTAGDADHVVTELRARIGELVRASAQLEAEVIELREGEQRLRGFAHTVAHDLVQPLTVLGGYLELIDEGDGDRDRVAGWLTLARRSHTATVEAVDALLRHAGADGAAALRREDLATLVHRALAPVQATLAAAGGAVEVAGSGEVLVDGGLFARVVQNLVLNSCRYRCEARPLLIRVEHRTVADVDVIRVVDNGRGFGAGEHEVVFADGRRGVAGEGLPGTGAGLAIVRSIVNDLGGKVWADDTPGGGATIAIALPQALKEPGAPR